MHDASFKIKAEKTKHRMERWSNEESIYAISGWEPPWKGLRVFFIHLHSFFFDHGWMFWYRCYTPDRKRFQFTLILAGPAPPQSPIWVNQSKHLQPLMCGTCDFLSLNIKDLTEKFMYCDNKTLIIIILRFATVPVLLLSNVSLLNFPENIVSALLYHIYSLNNCS